MECFLALFDAKTGVFCNEVFALLCMLEDTIALPQVVRNCSETTELLKQVDFSFSRDQRVNLSAVRVQLANVVREIVYKLNTTTTAAPVAALLGQRKHTRENLERLSALFDVPIPQSTVVTGETRTVATANLYASPDRARTSGVPTWISNATSSSRFYLLYFCIPTNNL